MNREIKFRGRRVDNGEWVYGYLIEDRYIVGPVVEWTEDYFNTEYWLRVDPETVGQYTGLKDRNGKEIYEGDICIDGDGRSIIRILWSDHHQWGCLIEKGCALSQGLTFPIWQWDKCKMNDYRQLEVIGNIYENPELLA